MRHTFIFIYLLVAVLVPSPLLEAAAPVQMGGSQAPILGRERAKSGTAVLEAFRNVAGLARHSVVQFEKDGEPVVLGTVVDAEGRVVTKASEIAGMDLLCRLANGQAAPAKLLAVDEDSDLALLKVTAKGLKPVQWAAQDVTLGQWAVTPGILAVPEAVGIVSTSPRRILPKRAVIGVLPDFNARSATIRDIMPGLGAEKAGLKPGDIIASVNATSITNGEQLVQVLRQYRKGQTVKLRVQRGEERLELNVEMMVAKPERLGRRFDRQERMNRLGGELSRRAEGFESAFQHDTVLHPWQCGGPLVNLEGHAVGLNIARAGRIASYALPAPLVQQLVTALKRQTDLPVKQQEGLQIR